MKRMATICLMLMIFAIVLAVAAPARADEIGGKVVGVYPDRHGFIIVSADGRGRTTSFEMAKNGRVFINNRPASLMDLQMGEDVVVTFVMQLDRPVAVEVRARSD